jgi:chloramphenicol 3-O phosphotransferase
MIILLNGTSSSGKTTIAKAMQEKYHNILLLYGVDSIVQNAFPMKCDYPPFDEHAIKVVVDNVDNEPFARLTVSPFMYPVYKAGVYFYKMLSQKGYDIIIDEVLFDENRISPYFEILNTEKVYFIAIKPSKQVAVKREIARKDRFRGFAAGLYEEVYNPLFIYDLIVDSGESTPEESADKILDYLEKIKTPQAFTCSAEKWFSRKGTGL